MEMPRPEDAVIARRGEILVLRWSHVDFERRCLHITEAWKGRKEIGSTKSGRRRIVPISVRVFEVLDTLRSASVNTEPDDFLFCY